MEKIEENGEVLFEYDATGRVVDAEVDEDGWEQMVCLLYTSDAADE